MYTYPFVALVADSVVLLLDDSGELCFKIFDVLGWLLLLLLLQY
jgi:hypothetical protein